MPILATIGILLLLAVVFGPQWWVKHVLAKHGSDRPDLPGTGGELARHLLDEMKLTDVKVEVTDKGDHYDPEDRAVRFCRSIMTDARSLPSPWRPTKSRTPFSTTAPTPRSYGASNW